jgi:hypothetical protein
VRPKLEPEVIAGVNRVDAAARRGSFFNDKTPQTRAGTMVSKTESAEARAKNGNIGNVEGSIHDGGRLRRMAGVCPRYVMLKPSDDGILAAQ